MLREYIEGKLRENEDLIMDLENDLKTLWERKKELERLIGIIEEESSDGSDIFSPRNHRDKKISQRNAYQNDLERVKAEIESVDMKLNQTRMKKDEYHSMLKEAQVLSEPIENGNYGNKDEEKVTNIESESTNRGAENKIEFEIQEELPETEKKLDHIEIKSGELFVLECERRKEKEFLAQIQNYIEECLSYSGSSRNKYRNEFKRIKKMIEDYIRSIEM